MKLTIFKGNHFPVPLCVAFSFVIGSVLFAKGFLLNRVEIQNQRQKCLDTRPSVMQPNSNTHNDITTRTNEFVTSSHETSCQQFKRFDKAIFLVIDALRYDFAVFDEEKVPDSTEPFENKLPVIKQLLQNEPQNSRLFKFIADPPTTTMQRLKGLTTGSLPTFIDAGKNFASSEITEDNLIYQMKNNGRRVISMGDDVWESLYRTHFHRSYPFPSFNVRDLHTVDNGCISHLVPEMETQDWDVIIAHFLGVDHCGHRFGPNHPVMAKKLQQMDEVIRSVVERLDNDTILFVFGDHGMTKMGDHGGDSPDEVSAALFVHSPLTLIGPTQEGPYKDTVAQIDLVPTVALLLGLPIPFSNLGRLIPDFFTIPSQSETFHSLPHETRSKLHYIIALNTNVAQVKTYIETYNNLTGAFPRSFLPEIKQIHRESQALLRKLVDEIRTGSNLSAIQQHLQDTEESLSTYLDLVRGMCDKTWTQFDDLPIALGICMVFTMLFMNIMVWFQVGMEISFLISIILQTMFLIHQWKSFSLFLLEIILVTIISFLSSRISPFVRGLNDPTKRLQFTEGNLGNLFTLAVGIVHCLSLTSNSFVMYEAKVATFLTSSVLTFVCVTSHMRTRTSTHHRKKLALGDIPKLLGLLLVFLACSRLSQLFWSCREEQPWCDVSAFMIPLSDLNFKASRLASARYIISVACVLAPVVALRQWLQKQGGHEGSRLRWYAINYTLFIAAISISLYWAMQASPSAILDTIPSWQQTLLPRIGYMALAVSFVSVLLWPVCVHVLPHEEAAKVREATRNYDTTQRPQPPSGSRGRKSAKRRGEGVIQEIASTTRDDVSEIPVVSGLGTAYSANMLQFLVTFYLLLSLLLSDGVAPALMLLVIQMLVAMEIWAIAAKNDDTQVVPYVPIWLIGLWSLMSAQYFFATGHQATIPSIRFETAFIGYYGNYPVFLHWIPATLILLNTFASQVILASALPLTLLWPLTRGRSSDGQHVGGLAGEMELQKEPDLFKRRLSHLILWYLTFQGLQLFGTMLSAALHRRHLMAWGIFAPRFIFQGVAFLVTLPALAVTCGILLYSHRAIRRWIREHLDM